MQLHRIASETRWLDPCSGGETAELVGVKVRGIATTFPAHQREMKPSPALAGYVCCICVAVRHDGSGQSARRATAPRIRAVRSVLGSLPERFVPSASEGRVVVGWKRGVSFRPVSQGDKRMIGRSVWTFLDRWNERRKAVRTVQETRCRSLAFSN